MKTSVVFVLFVFALSSEASAQPLWQACNGPYAGQVNSITVSRTGTVFVGTQSGGIFKSTDKGGSWAPINSGLSDTWVNCVAITPNGYIYASTWSKGLFRSTDDGQSWAPSNSGISDLSPPGVGALDFTPSGTVFAMANGGMYRSTDLGTSWKSINTGITWPSMTTLIVEPKSGYVFAGAAYNTSAQLYRSTNNGDSWNQVNTFSFWIHGLTVSTEGHILLCTGYDSFVRRSTDLGDSWPAYYVGSDLAKPQVLLATPRGGIFAGTDKTGVYQSKDDGHTWSAVNNGLPFGNIISLASNLDGYVFAGTESGGVYRSVSPITNIAAEMTPNDFQLDQNYPNPFNPSTTISYELAKNASVKLDVYDVMGRKIRSLLDDSKSAGYYTVVWNGRDEAGSDVSSGVYIYQFVATPSNGERAFKQSGKLMLTR